MHILLPNIYPQGQKSSLKENEVLKWLHQSRLEQEGSHHCPLNGVRARGQLISLMRRARNTQETVPYISK